MHNIPSEEENSLKKSLSLSIFSNPVVFFLWMLTVTIFSIRKINYYQYFLFPGTLR